VLCRPLRDVTSRELALLCHLAALPLGEPPGRLPLARRGARSANALAAGFVETLLAANPSAVSNIVGTAAKLRAFSWNDPPALHCRQVDKFRRSNMTARSSAAAPPPHGEGGADVLCSLCWAPLADDELPSGGELEAGQGGWSGCCESCQLQVLGGGGGGGEDGTAGAQLPEAIRRRMAALSAAAREAAGGRLACTPEEMRLAIQDCLLE
jgi:hypothetical protein